MGVEAEIFALALSIKEKRMVAEKKTVERPAFANVVVE